MQRDIDQLCRGLKIKYSTMVASDVVKNDIMVYVAERLGKIKRKYGSVVIDGFGVNAKFMPNENMIKGSFFVKPANKKRHYVLFEI